MLLHILKKDLKRKRVMNAIVLLFIMLAATFMASSASNLITITSAVDYFFSISKTPDFLAVAVSEDINTDLEEFLKTNKFVTEYEVMDMYALTDDDIEIVKCAADPDNHKYEKTNTVAVGALSQNFLKVFDKNDQLVSLANGEIAIPILLAEENQLSTGDVLKITCGDTQMEFTVKVIMKDAVFGTEMMEFKRFLITDEDYGILTEKSNTFHTLLFTVSCTDTEAFEKEFKRNDFQVIIALNSSILNMLYVFDMLIAGIFIIVSICLIVVSLLILRFTIVFTLQEDYKEIGIMKAIGIRDNSIKGIYLLKYLAISLIGAFLGLLFSFPFEKLLIEEATTNMVVKSAESSIMVNIGCAALIIVVVLAFCYSSTGKVKKFSAIEAIRNGSNGERYKAKTVFRLHKRNVITPAFYMAFNDVAGNVKRFLVLAIIFCIGTLEILLPMTAIHTLKDESIISSFGLQQSDAFINNGKVEQYINRENNDILLNDMKKMKEDLADAGMDAQVWVEIGYMIPCYSSDSQQAVRYFAQQVIGDKEDDYDVVDGRMPQLQNEIMITELTAKELNVEIGDSIYFKYPDRVEEYVITGTYQTLMNLGNGFRISHNAQMNSNYLSSIMAFQVNVNGGAQGNNLLDKIQEVFPDYRVLTGNEYVSSMIGGVLDKMDSIKLLIVGVVIVINVLITILIMKMLITKERGEIAMLKSVGFSNRTLRAWQSLRILLVLVFSIALGVVLAKILAPFLIGPIFVMMGGTSMKLIINPIEAYVICPLILLVATGVAAWLCAWDVNKVDLKEINTLE